MSRRKILLVFGTRPEAIKLAPLYHELSRYPDLFEPLCCATGQHRHLLDQVLEVFGIKPDFDLNVMQADQSPGDLTAVLLPAMREVFTVTRPDLVVVQGDTTSSMSAAMAAFYAAIPVAHVEAGLRTYDISAPFPEEFNRRVVGMLAYHHFAPTTVNKANLVREGCDPERIKVVGNTVVDAVGFMMERLTVDNGLRRCAEDALDKATRFEWRRTPYVLLTCHRRESFSGGIEEICGALDQLTRELPDIQFLVPVHPNPAVRRAILHRLGDNPRISLADPLPYPAFLLAIRNCLFVMTDSGGVQEEAPSFGKPLLVMRDRTERVEGERSGISRLVGTRREDIVGAAYDLARNPDTRAAMTSATNPFGDGLSARRIVDHFRDDRIPWHGGVGEQS